MKCITPYIDDWPNAFQQISRFLRVTLPETCLIHHVGSTSIPGMPAKNIIDLDIECPNGTMSSIIGALNGAGYFHEGDKGIPMREAFCPKMESPASKLPQHHLYACESQSPELFKHQAFRDYLILHVQRAKWLASKKIAIGKSAKSRAAYIEKKSDAYAIITIESLSWANKALQRVSTSRTTELKR